MLSRVLQLQEMKLLSGSLTVHRRKYHLKPWRNIFQYVFTQAKLVQKNIRSREQDPQ